MICNTLNKVHGYKNFKILKKYKFLYNLKKLINKNKTKIKKSKEINK